MLLGIDYGLSKIGLALSQGNFSEPKETLKVNNLDAALEKIVERITNWQVEKVVVGVSEGKSQKQAISFGEKLKLKTLTPIVYIDETLSTHEAGENHAVAAAIILQRYLDGEPEVTPTL